MGSVTSCSAVSAVHRRHCQCPTPSSALRLQLRKPQDPPRRHKRQRATAMQSSKNSRASSSSSRQPRRRRPRAGCWSPAFPAPGALGARCGGTASTRTSGACACGSRQAPAFGLLPCCGQWWPVSGEGSPCFHHTSLELGRALDAGSEAVVLVSGCRLHTQHCVLCRVSRLMLHCCMCSSCDHMAWYSATTHLLPVIPSMFLRPLRTVLRTCCIHCLASAHPKPRRCNSTPWRCVAWAGFDCQWAGLQDRGGSQDGCHQAVQ